MSSNPLRIQELLDLCITFLSESPADLLSCSLVARSWVNAAQSELFRIPHPMSVHSRSDRAARKFCNVLSALPRLGRHVRELSMGTWPTLIQNLDPVTFTHLHTLRFYITNVSLASDLYRPLLSLPTLGTLHLDTASRFSASIKFLALCPTIRHLNLSCREDFAELQADAAFSLSEKLPFIRLTSLQLEIIPGGEQVPPLHNLNQAALHPLDISELKALSIWGSSMIRWDSLPQAAQESIRIVDSNFWLGKLDLSPFKSLSVLRLGMIQGGVAESDVRCTLGSISPSNPIQIVVLGLSNGLLRYNKEECAQIDQILLSLASRGIRVELEFHLDTRGAEEKVRDSFPTIAAENKFHLVYRSYGMTNVWLRVR